MAKTLIVDGSTGETVERDLSVEELAALQATPTELLEEATRKAKERRRAAYATEADPLFFGWQRGENTEQEWLDKVAEIRAKYPYPA